jgi:hypothetical protein
MSELKVHSVLKGVLEVLDFPVGLFECLAEIIRFEHSTAPIGANVTILLKPSDLVSDWFATTGARQCYRVVVD